MSMMFFRFFASTFTITTVMFVVINFLAYYGTQLINKEEYFHEIVSDHIVHHSYISDKVIIESVPKYIHDNVRDLVDFAFLENKEFRYYPTLETVHNVFQSEHINITEDDYTLPHRKTKQYPCQNENSVYCFGGSTTFGYLVSDLHTWPSLLSEQLNGESPSCYRVFNFGSNAFTPSKETMQFLELLKMGNRPSIAIFLDGLNVGGKTEAGEFTSGISQLFEDANSIGIASNFIRRLPVYKWIRNIRFTGELIVDEPSSLLLPVNADSTTLTIISNRLVFNALIRERIGQMYGVKVMTILQPNSFLMPSTEDASKGVDLSVLQTLRLNYNFIYQTLLNNHRELFLDLSDLANTYNKSAFIDLVHYSPEFHQRLADTLSSVVKNKELKTHSFERDKINSTLIKKQQ